MFTIPEKGSPMDIARDLAYSPSVQAAIADLMCTLRSEAKRLGIPDSAITQAIALVNRQDIPLDDLISMKVEERFTDILTLLKSSG
jgi:hypothetical protein